MHSFKTLVTNTLVGGVGTTATLVIGVALKILLVRTLSVEDFGVLIGAQAIVAFVAFSSALCVADAVVWLAPRELEQSGSAGPAIASAASVGVASGCVALAIVAVVTKLTGQNQSALGPAVALLALTIPLNIAGDTFAGGLRAIGALWPKVIALDVGRPAVSLIVAALLASFGRLSLASMLATLIVASAATSVVPIILAWQNTETRPTKAWDTSRVRVILGYGVPLLAAGLLAGPLVNSGIPAILAVAVSPQQVAWYSAALALQVLVYMPTAAAEQAVLPRWASSNGPARTEFQAVTRWSVLLSSMPFAVLWLRPSALLDLTYGARYAGAGFLVKMTALTTLFGAAVGPNEAALRAGGDTRWIFGCRVVAAILGLAVASVLMKSWGATGAVAGFCTASVVVNGLYAWRLWGRQRVQPCSRAYFKGAFAMLAALFGTQLVLARFGGGNLMTLGTLIAVYPVALMAMLVAVGAEEPRLLRQGWGTLWRRRVLITAKWRDRVEREH